MSSDVLYDGKGFGGTSLLVTRAAVVYEGRRYMVGQVRRWYEKYESLFRDGSHRTCYINLDLGIWNRIAGTGDVTIASFHCDEEGRLSTADEEELKKLTSALDRWMAG